MRKRSIIIIILFIVAIIGYNYIYQDHRDIDSETAKFEVTANSIASNFSTNQKEAETKYLNQTIEVSGTISEFTDNSITLDDKVFCLFSNTIQNELSPNAKIKIKGRVIGYDDLLEQVKLDQSKVN